MEARSSSTQLPQLYIKGLLVGVGPSTRVWLRHMAEAALIAGGSKVAHEDRKLERLSEDPKLERLSEESNGPPLGWRDSDELMEGDAGEVGELDMKKWLEQVNGAAYEAGADPDVDKLLQSPVIIEPVEEPEDGLVGATEELEQVALEESSTGVEQVAKQLADDLTEREPIETDIDQNIEAPKSENVSDQISAPSKIPRPKT